jgi:hypothetical protein
MSNSTRAKNGAIRRQKLNLIVREFSPQMVCLSEKFFELMRKVEKQE